MIGLIQRVTEACVRIDAAVVGQIAAGLLVLVGVTPDDDEVRTDKLLERLLRYRVFADATGRMNRSLQDIGGGLLLVPQFTLAADTARGLRPGFSTAAAPELGFRLFTRLVAQARLQHAPVACGTFGAHMQVALVNDGPVTFWLES